MKRYAAFIGAPWGRGVLSLVSDLSICEATLDVGEGMIGTVVPCGLRYAFFLNWGHRVDRYMLDAVECVNFHCTRLPYGRGGHPIENLIKANHTETVITAHLMTSEIDAGPIYGVSEPISLAGTKLEIQERFIEPCANLIRWIVETEPTPKPQVGEPTYFKRLPQAEYRKFWAERGC